MPPCRYELISPRSTGVPVARSCWSVKWYRRRRPSPPERPVPTRRWTRSRSSRTTISAWSRSGNAFSWAGRTAPSPVKIRKRTNAGLESDCSPAAANRSASAATRACAAAGSSARAMASVSRPGAAASWSAAYRTAAYGPTTVATPSGRPQLGFEVLERADVLVREQPDWVAAEQDEHRLAAELVLVADVVLEHLGGR